MAVLWEDKQSSSYLRTLKADLIRTLRNAECEDIITRQKGKIGIVRTQVDCDYYDWLDSKSYAVNLYHGEYMAQYSWSEMTNAGMKGKK